MRTDTADAGQPLEDPESGYYRLWRNAFVRSTRGRARLVRRREEIEGAWDGLTAIEASGFALSLETGRYLGPVRLNEDGALLSAVGQPEQPVLVQLEGYAVAYRFAWDPRAAGPPDELHCEATRQDRRARVSRRVKVDVWMEGSGAVREVIQLDVRDVSHGGVGVTFGDRAQRLRSGQKIDRLVIRWKGGDILQGSAVVAHVSPDPSRGTARCGLVLEFSAETWARWHALVDAILHPNTVQGPLEPRVFWDAYLESGYLNLSGKAPSEFEGELARFEESQRRLSRAPRVGAAFAAGDKNRLEAFAHQLQVWDGSWLWYHLCRLPTGRSLETSDDHVLVDLYSRAYHYVREHGAKWLVTYIQKTAGYSRLVHHVSALELEGSGTSCVVPVHVLEIACSDAVSGLPPEVGVATSAELDEVRKRLAAEHPRLYLEATGLGAQDLRLEDLTTLWADHGLERRREVLVVRVGGAVAAFCVLDAASPGLHLYGLLDCARVFVSREFEGTDAFIPCLLRAATSWYRNLGRTRFIYFRDPERDPVDAPPGSTSLGEAYVTVHSVEAIPHLLERVFVLAAPNGTRVQRRNTSETT